MDDFKIESGLPGEARSACISYQWRKKLEETLLRLKDGESFVVQKTQVSYGYAGQITSKMSQRGIGKFSIRKIDADSFRVFRLSGNQPDIF